jgi:hypothetical protein
MIDVTRVKKTAGGYSVRIYHADETLIHGALFLDEKWQLSEWMPDGRMKWASSLLDLVEESETVEIDCWANVYPGGLLITWPTESEANAHSCDSRIACVNIKRTVTKGEGL